ncbi:MAG: hypothetical protein ACOYM8_16815 [Caulobacterales bacterium]
MWSLLSRNVRTIIVLTLGFLVTAVASLAMELVTGEGKPAWQLVSLAAAAISTVVIPAMEAAWPTVWRYIPLLNAKVFPDLNGTWEGKVYPTAHDERVVSVRIRQTLFDVFVSMKSAEAESKSVRASFEIDRSAHKARIWYAYEARPNPELLPANPRHDGMACLEVDLDGPYTELSGRYFTERGTLGKIALSRAPTRVSAGG